MLDKNNLIMSYFKPPKYPDQESVAAEEMFLKFLEDGFDYDEMLKCADDLVYPTAEYLIFLIPEIIDEMIKRKDFGYFINYPVIGAIDPEKYSDELYKMRTEELIRLADKEFANKICIFLEALKENPPNGIEQINRLLKFWSSKAK